MNAGTKQKLTVAKTAKLLQYKNVYACNEIRFKKQRVPSLVRKGSVVYGIRKFINQLNLAHNFI
jgi:hypothetical protein